MLSLPLEAITLAEPGFLCLLNGGQGNACHGVWRCWEVVAKVTHMKPIKSIRALLWFVRLESAGFGGHRLYASLAVFRFLRGMLFPLERTNPVILLGRARGYTLRTTG